jgi:SSS family transporter
LSPTAPARPVVVVLALVSLALVLIIGLAAARRTRVARDFFIAGQGIGLLVTALATMAAAFSGFVFLGGPGLTYRLGAPSLFIIVPVSFTSTLLCWVLARRLRGLAGVREIYTIPDAIACRYHNRAVTCLAAVTIALGSVGYLGAQLLALGVMVQSVLSLGSLALGIAIGLAVVLAYTAAGGMRSGVYADVLQGCLMLAAAVGVFFHAIHVAGGWTELTRSLANSERFGPSFLDPVGRASVRTAFGLFFVFSVGVLGQPHVLHKFYMLDEAWKLRWMPLVLGPAQVLCLMLWVGLGLAVPALVAQGKLAPLERPDDAAPAYLMGFAPDLLAGLVVAAVLAAIMSTANSLLNIASAAVVRDLPKALGRPPGDELRRGRWATVGLALLAAAFAYLRGDLVARIGTLAFGIFAAGLAPALAIGLNWERVTARAASASIVTGTSSLVLLELLGAGHASGPFGGGMLPEAVALAASFTVLFVATWLTARRGGGEPALDEDIRRVLRG